MNRLSRILLAVVSHHTIINNVVFHQRRRRKQSASFTLNTDGDGVGDNADLDDDNDGFDDTNDLFPLDPFEALDTDGDGIGNSADTDDDGDGVPDGLDAYPLDAGNNQMNVFDIDGNGQVDALTDSLLIMRYTFGFSGAELIDDALGEGSTRTGTEEIEAYLESVMPAL